RRTSSRAVSPPSPSVSFSAATCTTGSSPLHWDRFPGTAARPSAWHRRGAISSSFTPSSAPTARCTTPQPASLVRSASGQKRRNEKSAPEALLEIHDSGDDEMLLVPGATPLVRHDLPDPPLSPVRERHAVQRAVASDLGPGSAHR